MTKPGYREMGAADENCATCQFWPGTRKVNAAKKTVKVKWDECARCPINPDGISGMPHFRCDKYECLADIKPDSNVRINIRRGATQIGGSAVEITATNGQRIVVDIGLPLDAEKNMPDLLPDIRGLRKKTDDLLGILISHAHQDHYGLGKWIDPAIPVYIGAAANRIICAADKYLARVGMMETFSFQNVVEISENKSFDVGPFRITPYLVDHAAYKSMAFLIEVDGKRIFYTGDFRAHGRTKQCTEKLIANPPENIDVLLMEGSSLERLDPDGRFKTESALERDFRQKFKSAKGIVMVQSSSQNVDRIVSIYRGAKESGRILVMASYTGLMMMTTQNKHLPNFTWRNVKKLAVNPKKRHEISPAKIAEHPEKYVYIIGAGHIDKLAAAGLLNSDALYVFSMWQGYFDTIAKPVIDKMAKYGVPIVRIHTSGHADIPTLQRMVDAVRPKMLVPIHTFCPDLFPKLFGATTNVKLYADNHEFRVP